MADEDDLEVVASNSVLYEKESAVDTNATARDEKGNRLNQIVPNVLQLLEVDFGLVLGRGDLLLKSSSQLHAYLQRAGRGKLSPHRHPVSTLESTSANRRQSRRLSRHARPGKGYPLLGCQELARGSCWMCRAVRECEMSRG